MVIEYDKSISSSVAQKQILIPKDYDDIIKEQLAEGVIGKAPSVSQPKEFYIPHKSVIRKSAETTKMRIVYEASSRAMPNSPLLNDCLYPGPVL